MLLPDGQELPRQNHEDLLRGVFGEVFRNAKAPKIPPDEIAVFMDETT
ncbi:hypothetical protein AKJ09_10683 [Labilithrix luteola]|uniref:Uncharacterized protein n=1 Tax=Labilithrix luteola TaxID=1391654 RepID=A0A0K1QF08_9BACT|nr:hypothetical protein AKJ09_10683 [Labilithrix luteola]